MVINTILTKIVLLGGFIVIIKAYTWLKNDIENTKMTIVIAEILAFILLWSQMCLIYLTQPIGEFYSIFLEKSLIITSLISIIFIAIVFGLFIVSSFGIAKIVHEIRVKLVHE